MFLPVAEDRPELVGAAGALLATRLTALSIDLDETLSGELTASTRDLELGVDDELSEGENRSTTLGNDFVAVVKRLIQGLLQCKKRK
tara:strand:+ start:116 stop:376 length:261 start_codon:yes stop_codon:yes gene_type:complete